MARTQRPVMCHNFRTDRRTSTPYEPRGSVLHPRTHPSAVWHAPALPCSSCTATRGRGVAAPEQGGATPSTTSTRQLLGAIDAQTAHHVTSSTAPAHQLLIGIGTQPAYALFPAYTAQKSKFPKLILYYTVITSNDHPRYVKSMI